MCSTTNLLCLQSYMSYPQQQLLNQHKLCMSRKNISCLMFLRPLVLVNSICKFVSLVFFIKFLLFYVNSTASICYFNMKRLLSQDNKVIQVWKGCLVRHPTQSRASSGVRPCCSGLEMSKDGDSTKVFLQENLNTQCKNLIFRQLLQITVLFFCCALQNSSLFAL